MIDRLHKRLIERIEFLSSLYSSIPQNKLLEAISDEIENYKFESSKPVRDYWDCDL